MTRHLPLRRTIPLLLLSLVVTGALGLAAMDWYTARRDTRAQMLRRVLALSRVVTPSLERAESEGESQEARDEVLRLAVVPQVLLALACDERNRILTATEPGIQDHAVEAVTPAATELVNAARSSMTAQSGVAPEGDAVASAQPFYLPALPGEARPSRVAVLYIRMDLAEPMREARASILQRTVAMTAATAVGCLVVWLYLRRRLTRQLDLLLRGVAAWSAGTMPLDLPTTGNDELAQIGRALTRALTEVDAGRQALMRSEARYRHLIGEAPVAIAIARDGRLVYANDAFTRVYGYDSATSPIGRSVVDFVSPDSLATFENRARRRDAGMPIEQRYEAVAVRADGSLFPVLATTSRIELPDGPAVIGFFEDMSLSKQAESDREHLQAQLVQSQKMESVGRLAGGVAHDFNNMLSVILGQAEIGLELTAADHPAHATLVEIHKAAERSGRLTHQLLAFARRQPIAPRVVDLNATVQDTLSMLRRLIGEQVTLAWHPGKDIPRVKIDPGQIDQVLANLCVNGRDAIAGVGTLTIDTRRATLDAAFFATHPDTPPGEYTALSITDTGSGMDEATLTHIFEPFFTTKPVGEGTGLGLATVYGIVTQNAGTITVDTELGRGTTFTIYLPACPDAANTEQAVRASRVPGGTETIMVVEDEATVLKLETLLLESLGYTIIAAENPVSALVVLHERGADVSLLLTDVIMPTMSGRELAEAVRREWPHIRVLFMSGYTADVLCAGGQAALEYDLLPKPFTRRQLAARVRAALDAH